MSLPPSHSLVLLVAWWCKNPVRTLSATAADLQTDGAVRHWPLGAGSPPGTKNGSPPVVGILFHIGERRSQATFVAGESFGPAARWDKWTRRDTRKVDPP
jgi:hypothetical protein